MYLPAETDKYRFFLFADKRITKSKQVFYGVQKSAFELDPRTRFLAVHTRMLLHLFVFGLFYSSCTNHKYIYISSGLIDY